MDFKPDTCVVGKKQPQWLRRVIAMRNPFDPDVLVYETYVLATGEKFSDLFHCCSPKALRSWAGRLATEAEIARCKMAPIPDYVTNPREEMMDLVKRLFGET